MFGYGSLVWRPAFPFVEQVPASLDGFVRRFWQASPDHRGTPEAPGRVVTLVAHAGGRVHGRAFRVGAADVAGVLAALDHREKAGYDALDVTLALADGRSVGARVYVATPANPEFLGPAAPDVIARQIASSHGPSGSNLEYLERLHDALAELGVPDPHVTELLAAVRGLGVASGGRRESR